MSQLIELPKDLDYEKVLGALKNTPQVQDLTEKGNITTWSLKGFEFVMSKDSEGGTLVSLLKSSDVKAFTALYDVFFKATA
jgi:hypothetical protein